MMKYTFAHFVHEEQLMAAVPYSGFQAHVQQHDKLRQSARVFMERFERGETTITIELMLFLSEWVRRHVVTFDRQMGEYLYTHRNASALRGSVRSREPQLEQITDVVESVRTPVGLRNQSATFARSISRETIPSLSEPMRPVRPVRSTTPIRSFMDRFRTMVGPQDSTSGTTRRADRTLSKHHQIDVSRPFIPIGFTSLKLDNIP